MPAALSAPDADAEDPSLEEVPVPVDGGRDLPAVERPTCLSVSDVHLTLGGRTILDDVAFSVGRGEIVGILGRNGSGKSSLLSTIVGLRKADRGSFCLGHESLLLNPTLRSRIGVVFQEPSLDKMLSAGENLALAGRLLGLSRKEAWGRALELLQFVHLEDRMGDRVGTFSGGMRRRVEIARALVGDPELLLMDEPTYGLDPESFERTWRQFETLRRLRQVSILLTTHRGDEAERCDRLIFLERGHVVVEGAPEVLVGRIADDVLRLTSDEDWVIEAMEEALSLQGKREGPDIVVELANAHDHVASIVSHFPPGTFKAIAIEKPSLERLFYHLTGASLHEGEGS